MKPRIFLVEDEEHMHEAIKTNLELEGYEVVGAFDGKEAIRKFEKQNFHLVILDVMLPHRDGFTVCETIRVHNPDVPVIFITAKGTNEDKLAGFKSGGDDYLVKPFALEEMLARVKALVRRGMKMNGHERRKTELIKFGRCQINFKNMMIKDVRGDEYEISKRESELLRLLIERKNQIVSRDDIYKIVWGYDVFPDTRTIDNFILVFRKYFEKDPHNPKHFFSVRGVGYKFID